LARFGAHLAVTPVVGPEASNAAVAMSGTMSQRTAAETTLG